MKICLQLWVLFALIIMTGCASTAELDGPTQNEILESYVGFHYSRFIQANGPPNAIYSDGLDGEILVYSRQASRHVSGSETTTSNVRIDEYGNTVSGRARTTTETTLPQTITWESYNMMYVNPEDTIYHYRTNRLSAAERKAAEREQSQKLWTGLGVITAIGVVLVYLSSQENYN